MNHLKVLLNMLNCRKDNPGGSFFIPEAWNYWGFERIAADSGRPGEISVDPYDFINECIEKNILADHCTDTDILDPVGLHGGFSGAEPARHTIYSMLPRMLTAWEHYGKGNICGGTFLKAICLLPFIKGLGADIIYLLPVFRYSSRYRKGELGSPYSIKNIYKLDENLHDPLLGGFTEELLELEFKAFIEACHMLGIKVMVDFAFRTVSRDSDLILEHPDWFYWIDIKYSHDFRAPVVESAPGPLSMNDKTLKALYTSHGLPRYLAKFVCSPDRADPAKWAELVTDCEKTGENILDMVEGRFGITTQPGFSDVVNDSQPLWTDVTYLRFYFDSNEKVGKYLPENQPPYIMQDGVCLVLYPGKKENTGLMEYISDVIPYYQDKFGIDGARIDMGHALTPSLKSDIVGKAKKKNQNFILWSEEFDPAKSGTSRQDGFHFISGMLFSKYRDFDKPGFNRTVIKDTLLKAEIPVIAALETADSPRAAWVHKDRVRLAQLILLNAFLPNTVQFINNGFELMETQPMNLGLDNSELGRFVLEESDPMYGKLAFFDNYRLHWLNDEQFWIRGLISISNGLRQRFIDILSLKDNFMEQPKIYGNSKLTFLYYSNKAAGRGLFFLANRDRCRRAGYDPAELLPEQESVAICEVNVIYRNDFGDSAGEAGKPYSAEQSGMVYGKEQVYKGRRFLKPGEVLIGEVIYEKKGTQ